MGDTTAPEDTGYMEKLDGTDYLTAGEVAEQKGCDVRVVLSALRGNRLAGVKRLGRWLVLPADAQAWTPGTWGDASRMRKKEVEK